MISDGAIGEEGVVAHLLFDNFIIYRCSFLIDHVF